MGRVWILLLTLLLLPTVFSLEQEDRLYFDQQNQKTIAQITAKIDGSVTKVQTDYANELETQKQIIRDEITTDVKNAMKSMTIGIFGIILVSLAVFRLIELRLSHNRNIIRYENLLKQENKVFEEQLLELANYRKELDIYRDELLKQGKMLGLKKEPIKLPKPAFKVNYRIVLMIFGIIISAVIIGSYIYWKITSGNIGDAVSQ